MAKIECHSCHGRYPPPMWKPAFKPEYIDSNGKPRIPEGKRVADIIEGLTCPRCKAFMNVQAKPGRLWRIELKSLS